MFAAVTSWALYTIIGRKVLGGLSPLAATNYAALWGTLLLGAVAAPHFDDAARPRSSTGRVIASLLYLGVLGTALAFVWYYMSVKKLGASVGQHLQQSRAGVRSGDQCDGAGRGAAAVDADRRRHRDRGRDDGVADLALRRSPYSITMLSRCWRRIG